VIGIKSSTEIEEIKRLAKTFQIYIVFDNDEAGKITKEKL
jgi:5S rRNA maturation endonuclease (ribonuclease M5)